MAPRALMRFPDARWLCLEEPLEVLRATVPAEVPSLLREVEDACARDRAAVGWVAYEAASAFDPALVCQNASTPVASFLLARQWRWLGEDELALQGAALDLNWRPAIAESRYLEALESIRNGIEQGDFYQVNYTFQHLASAPGERGAQEIGDLAWSLFANLQRAQRGAYAAFLLDGERAVCSASPELFFSLEGTRVVSKPMKGTARRGLDLSSDRQRLASLLASEKERAENLMIVDMVRNDLGRIAQPGSVHVDELFATLTFPTVHQMTSTVSASSSASLPELFAALFPAASITGAPKSSSMAAIRRLEASPRGIYTGTVGCVLPNRRMQWNVAIRTAVVEAEPAKPLETGAERPQKARESLRLSYGTGSGVVADSDARAEWRECGLKAINLSYRLPRFQLLESLRFTPRHGFWWRDLHVERLRASAEYFGFALREGAVQRLLQSRGAQLARQGGGCWKVRLLLDRAGLLHTECEPISLRPRPRWRVALATSPVSSKDRFLRHKTTFRGVYREALQLARRDARKLGHGEIDDVLLFNEGGELTESTMANVLVAPAACELGHWCTPPVDSGLLAGVLREVLLRRGRVVERRLTLQDLEGARRVLLVNSVRGVIDVEMVKNR